MNVATVCMDWYLQKRSGACCTHCPVEDTIWNSQEWIGMVFSITSLDFFFKQGMRTQVPSVFAFEPLQLSWLVLVGWSSTNLSQCDFVTTGALILP